MLSGNDEHREVAWQEGSFPAALIILAYYPSFVNSKLIFNYSIISLSGQYFILIYLIFLLKLLFQKRKVVVHVQIEKDGRYGSSSLYALVRDMVVA